MRKQEIKETSWEKEIELKSNIKVNISLGNLDDSINFLGDEEIKEKIKYISPGWTWGEPSLIFQIWKSYRLFDKEWKFASEQKLEDFKKHVNENNYPTLEIKDKSNQGVTTKTVKLEDIKINNINIKESEESDIITSSWENIAVMLRDSDKIFVDDNNGNFVFESKKALKFLSSIINESFSQTVEYQDNQSEELKESHDTTDHRQDEEEKDDSLEIKIEQPPKDNNH